MFSLQTERAIYLTKTPFQLQCKLHDHLMPFFHGSLTLAIVHEKDYVLSEEMSLKASCFAVKQQF